MKHYKFFLSLITLFSLCINASAQKEIPDSTEVLFDSNGSFTRVINTPEEVDAKLITINPLIDEVVWRKVVGRVIDLREQVNRPLYYPNGDETKDNAMDESSQKNLFAIIVYNLYKGNLDAYINTTIGGPDVPQFTDEYKVKYEDINFFHDTEDMQDERYTEIYDKINYITPGIIKYYIQEVWYFNKTTSTFHNKIIAIAPVFDERYHVNEGASGNIGSSDPIFWIPYDKLRPFLQEEFVKMTGRNITPLVNFDEFFTTRQFYAYIVKDYDMTSRQLKDISNDPVYLKQEQDRIENEILNFEQDLWSY